MITLRVIVDEMLAPLPGGIARYTEELTRGLIETAPAGCAVEGIVSASTEAEYADLENRLPGLVTLYKSSLSRRELVTAWQHGFTRLPGMIHAPSLLAPLWNHDRVNSRAEQIVVTLHDVVAWTHPTSVGTRTAAWQIAMVKRAHRYADALIVPTHAVAEQLTEFFDFGDRVRVIGGAVSTSLALPANADERARALGLPERYIMTTGGVDERRGTDQLLRALANSSELTVPLIVVGHEGKGAGSVADAAAELGIAADRVLVLGYLPDPDLSVVLARASALVLPSLVDGFGLPMLEAFHFGTPVVLSDAPALVEVAGGAGQVVALDELATYPERLAESIVRVLADRDLAARLSQAGRDRANLFSWQNSADKVWQLHADL
jgi:glycosyltransferase involved in cell wall biosynthesis